MGQARLAGRFQERSQHDQWLRAGRREAYSAFIAQATAFQHEAEMMFTAVTKARDSAGASDLNALRRHLPDLLQRVHDHIPALRATAALIAVEGPREVAGPADRIVRQVEDVNADLGRVTVEDEVDEADEEHGTGIGVTMPAGPPRQGAGSLRGQGSADPSR